MLKVGRMTAAGALLLGVFGAAFFFLSRTTASQAQAKPPLDPQILALGQRLYENQCAVCHGTAGAGDGPVSYLLYPKPRDFTRNEFRLVSTSSMQATDEDLFQTITRGMPGSSMPSWKHLSGKERWALVYMVRHLTGVKKEIPPEAKIQVPQETPVTEEGLKRGRELFVKACAACHGLQGKGDGPQKMTDTSGYPVRPRDLTAGIFKGSSSSEDLYVRIEAGIPGSPMPGYPEVFTDEQIWDMIHYVQTLPAKGAEERARVGRGRILVKKAKHADGDPLSESWLKIEPVFVSLMPLWWRNDRVEGVEVKAVHDGKRIALHLSWQDPTKDDSLASAQSFSDGAAVQLSADKDVPTFAMGNAERPVALWNWKAAWQEDLKEWKDVESSYPDMAVDWYDSDTHYKHGESFEAAESKTRFHDPQFLSGWGSGNPLSDPGKKSAGEEALSKGFGTLTTQLPRSGPIEVNGIWKEGKWQVVFSRALKTGESSLELERRKPLQAAFAVWDGAHRDRNGQKAVSVWNELVLE
ncbi:MAG: c-type cytochrome [Candidatus Omnitrophica bacterium]|nr:c-type cytochrome [Candidatus Omnitrophota bacterium]